MFTMIVLAVLGTVLLLVLAVVVGVVDAAQAPRWRAVAADRRRAWESGGHRANGYPADEHPTGPQPLSGRR
jgi:type II secretory pathway pseudopilin PulG